MFFDISAQQYCGEKMFHVHRPASLSNPKDHAVMFVQERYLEQTSSLYHVKDCIIFWPSQIQIPSTLAKAHAVVPVEDPHLRFCQFFQENGVTNLPPREDMQLQNGYWVSPDAVIGRNVTILQGVYIGGQVSIDDNSYIGAGAKLTGIVRIGKNVVIRENTVIGADGLTTDRDLHGRAVTMPQFGGVVLEDDVQVGANSVIARGAIDDTIIARGSKVDSCCYISHNVLLGEDTFVVGESILFGSVTTGARVMISGNATIRNGLHIGEDSFIGMGSTVVRPVEPGSVVKGNPAK